LPEVAALIGTRKYTGVRQDVTAVTEWSTQG